MSFTKKNKINLQMFAEDEPTNEDLLKEMQKIKEENERLKKQTNSTTVIEALKKDREDFKKEKELLKQENEKLMALNEDFKTKINNSEDEKLKMLMEEKEKLEKENLHEQELKTAIEIAEQAKLEKNKAKKELEDKIKILEEEKAKIIFENKINIMKRDKPYIAKDLEEKVKTPEDLEGFLKFVNLEEKERLYKEEQNRGSLIGNEIPDTEINTDDTNKDEERELSPYEKRLQENGVKK